jgi:hypothetical protein
LFNISSSSIATAVLVRNVRALGRSRRTEEEDIKMDLK